MQKQTPQPFLSKRFASWLEKRIPPASRVALSQKNIFIFPTKAGFVFGLLLITLILGAINYQNSLVYGVAFLLGSMFIVTILYTFRNLSGLTLELSETEPGFVGEDLGLAVRVTRLKGRGREGVQIGWPSSFKQWVDLLDKEADVVKLYVRAEQRGWLKPGRLLVETYYPLGLLRAWTWVDIEAHVLVFPRPIFDREVRAPSHIQRDDGVLMDPLGSDDFVDLKQYVAGDPIKNIMWRTFARTDELVIKQYASYIEPRLWFDLAALTGDIEEKLSRLTGLVLQATRAEREFGVRLPNKDIQPGVGQVHLNYVLTELALYGLTAEMSINPSSKAGKGNMAQSNLFSTHHANPVAASTKVASE